MVRSADEGLFTGITYFWVEAAFQTEHDIGIDLGTFVGETDVTSEWRGDDVAVERSVTKPALYLKNIHNNRKKINSCWWR